MKREVMYRQSYEQRDIAIGHEELGDRLAAQSQLGQALEAYGAGLAIAETLAEADPSNATWQRDLLVSFAKLGSVLEQSGDLAAAASRYEWARQISVRLSESDPSNATWRNDRAWIEARLASLKGGHSQSG